MSPFCTKTIKKNTNAPPYIQVRVRLSNEYSQTILYILRLFSDYSQTILRPDKTRVDQPTVLVG